MSGPAMLVVAKAPVPGLVKTRLAAVVGAQAAARLAHAALLDTIDACEEAVGAERCFVALAGSLPDAVGGRSLTSRLGRWTVVPQRGRGLAQRLARAHVDVAALTGAAVVQVGMDSPQATATDLLEVASFVDGGRGADAVLGRADDGGWWVLGLRRSRWAGTLTAVPMSTASTYDATRAALGAAGAAVATAPPLRDVDTVTDAEIVAGAAPGTRFAACWAEVAAAPVGLTRTPDEGRAVR